MSDTTADTPNVEPGGQPSAKAHQAFIRSWATCNDNGVAFVEAEGRIVIVARGLAVQHCRAFLAALAELSAKGIRDYMRGTEPV